MDPGDLLRTGEIDKALEELQEEIRQDPSNPQRRVFLFQLLCVLGQWERALTQLNVLTELDASTLAMAQTYRVALECEVFRSQVFAGQRTPLVFGEPEQWVALLINALAPIAQGHYKTARALRDEAYEAAPAVTGSIDQTPFEWVTDADSRLGPILEVIVNGQYYWLPLNRVHDIRLDEPQDLRDLVWIPGHFTWVNGGEAVGLIPTRYPGTEAAEDPLLRLARKTVWEAFADETYLGLGQRMLATDVAEYPLLDIRRITLGAEEGATSVEEAGGGNAAGLGPGELDG